MPSYTLPYTGVLDVPANTMLGNNTGSAAAAIGMTQAQTLTFLGDPGGAFGADAATQITPSTAIVLDEATGNEIGLDLSYVVNKATSGKRHRPAIEHDRHGQSGHITADGFAGGRDQCAECR